MIRSKRVILTALTAIFLSLPVALFAQMSADPPQVRVDKVTEREPVIYRRYNGLFDPIETVTSTARVSGTLEKVNFSEGDMVKKGDILYEIEDVRYKAEVQAAESKIDVIKAKIRYAENNYQRNERLAATQAVAIDTAENTKSVLEGFKAELLGAEAQLILAQEDLKYTKIESMLTGRVGRTNYTAGNYITPNSGKLVTVVQIDPIYVRFSMSEKDFTDLFGNLENLQKKAKLSLKLANGKEYEEPGTISFIDNQIQSKTDTIYVWATYKNSNSILNPGGLGTVQLSYGTGEKRPAVSPSAVMFDQNGHFVYAITDGEFPDLNQFGQPTETMHPGKTVVRKDVTLGPSDGQYQTIMSGLEVGEIIVVDGTHKAKPGIEITPVDMDNQKLTSGSDSQNTASPSEGTTAPQTAE